MTPDTRNITIARDTLGMIFGFIGVSASAFAVIAFVWYLQFNLVVLAALGVGLFGLVAWAVIAPQSFTATLTGRQARYSTGATLAGILLLGIIVLTYIIIQRMNLGFDATAGMVFSLSDASFEVIERIPADRRVQITGFYSADALPQRDLDDQFLRQYEIETEGKIIVRYIDPAEQPALAQRFGVLDDGEIFLSFIDEDENIDFDSLVFVPRDGRQERDITSALQQMLSTQISTVYFDESQGALSIYDETDRGLTLIDNMLRSNGVQTNFLNLSDLAFSNEAIPSDARAVVLPRRQAALDGDEIAVLDAYLQGGGSLLILTDVLFNEAPFLAEDSPFNAYLAERFGISALDAAIVETPELSVQTPLDALSYAVFTEHPVGQGIPAEDNVYFRIARPILLSADKPDTVANGRLISTSPFSYGETDLLTLAEQNTFEFDPDSDIQGPMDVAVWAWDEQGSGAKVILIGDGDFAMNTTIDSGTLGNIALATESVRWLAGIDEVLSFGFAANPSAIPTIFVSARQLDIIGIITIVIMPLTVLLTGITVWYLRTLR